MHGRKQYSIVGLVLVCLISSTCGNKQTGKQHESDKGISQQLVEFVSWHKRIELQLPDTVGIAEIPQLRLDGEWRLYVRLNPSWSIAVFDTCGRYLAKIGSHGFGPGQVGNIAFFQVDTSRNIYVFDNITQRLVEYNPVSGWLRTTKPPSPGVMAFVKVKDRYIFFRRAYSGDESYHIQICQSAGGEFRPVKQLLKSSEESIRTRRLASTAIAVNNQGVVLFAFFAPKVVYGITPDLELFDIQIDPSRFKISRTDVLLKKAQIKGKGGFISEIFENSRVISLGFVNDDVFLLSFATGRYAQTRFYVQLYSLSRESAISEAIQIGRPLTYIDRNAFASWSFVAEDTTTTREHYIVELFKFTAK